MVSVERILRERVGREVWNVRKESLCPPELKRAEIGDRMQSLYLGGVARKTWTT